MSHAATPEIVNDARFAAGAWASGGSDGVGCWLGGSAGQGIASLTGSVERFGDPIAAMLGDSSTTLFVYARVDGGGLVLCTEDFACLYLFLPERFVPGRAYPLVYAYGGHSPPCFAAGTRIATARGEVPVEGLRVGDRAVALHSRRYAEIIWLGHRRVDCRAHPHPEEVLPIRIAASAFATDMPHRDLLLSPDHALLVDGALVPARCLVNGATITQEPVAAVTYLHVELDRHDVLLADGLAAESFLDTGNRSAFRNTVGPMRVHPSIARRVWEAKACAPRQLDPQTHYPLRRRLLARTAVLGRMPTDDPDLRLFADGVPVIPVRTGVSWRAELPAGTREVRLASRASVPAHIVADSADRRRLGMAITRLALDGVAVPLGDRRRAAGWYPAEPTLQWTNGDATLICEPTHEGPRVLEVVAAPLLRYWLPWTVPPRVAFAA